MKGSTLEKQLYNSKTNLQIKKAIDVDFKFLTKTTKKSKVSVLPVSVLGTGFYVPEKIVTNQDIENQYGISKAWIEQVSGISERRICDLNEHCSDLGLKASQAALKNAELDPLDIDLIILASACPDFTTPPTACLIQDRIGAKNAVGFDIEVACMSFIWGLFIGTQFINNGIYNHILVVASELTSRGANYKDKNTFILLGDGAGAAILSNTDNDDTKAKRGTKTTNIKTSGILSYYLKSDGSKWDFATILAGGSKYNKYYEDQDREKYLFKMKGLDIFKFAVRAIPEVLTELIRKADLGLKDIDWVIPHQANLRILESAIKKSGVPKEKWIINVQRYGNSSAATIPLALAEANDKGMIQKGDLIALIGFGAGLNWGGLLIRW